MADGTRALYPSLTDKVVFITGGASGIGASMVQSFSQQGARVVFIDIDDEAAWNLSLSCEGRHKPVFVHCDIREVDSIRKAIDSTAHEIGPISVVVNNAAIDTRHTLEELTPEMWDDRMSINLRPMYFVVQAVAEQMKSLGGGSIINMGSVSWKIGQSEMPVYTTAKAAVHGLTRALARGLGSFNIRVNTLLPGWVMTDRQLKLWVTPETDLQIAKMQCVKRRIQPIDIASMALFLAADDSSMCTSQEFIVDGGWV